MSVLKAFEREVFDLLAAGALSTGQIEAVASEGTFVSYEYTGSGYFLTLAHPTLPRERVVCSQPAVMGHAEGIDCGFVLFIENGELMFECHTWGPVDVPEGFREKTVQVEVFSSTGKNEDT
jgi:hypothetical protein